MLLFLKRLESSFMKFSQKKTFDKNILVKNVDDFGL